jgi:hypothetical protein
VTLSSSLAHRAHGGDAEWKLNCSVVRALMRFHHYFLRWIGTSRMGASPLMLPPLLDGARVRSMCIHRPSVRTRRCHAQRHVRTRPSEKHGASGPHATRPVNVPVLSSSSVVAKVRLHGLIPCASSCACKQTVRHPSRDFGPGHAWSHSLVRPASALAARVSVPAACWLASCCG